MLIQSKGPKQWLVDEHQQDEKRRDHPAREFGHEPIVMGTFNPLTAREDDGDVIQRLRDKISSRGVGSFATSTLRGRTVKVVMIARKGTENIYRWYIRENGKVIQEGVI